MNDQVCPRCCEKIEPLLSICGSHVKATCPICLEYIKFVPQDTLTSLALIRKVIWSIGQQNERFINSCKILCKFTPDYIGYWNLYLKVKQMLKDAGIECKVS